SSDDERRVAAAPASRSAGGNGCDSSGGLGCPQNGSSGWLVSMQEPAVTDQLTRRPWSELPGDGVAGRQREVGGPIRLTGATVHHPSTAAGRAAAERLR